MKGGLRTSSLELLRNEMKRQRDKWGARSHDSPYWAIILMEEVGEAAKAILDQSPSGDLKDELVQVAAVCISWLQAMEDSRRRWGRRNREG